MFHSNGLHRKVDETVGRILLRRLEEEPDGEACRLVSRDGEVVSVSVRSLIERAMAYASAYGPASPDRKIIGVCLYSGLDLHAAFLGAIWAGHIPTMLAPPSPRMEPGKYIDSFCRMLRHVRPSYLVVDTTATERFDRLALRDFPEARLIDPANVPAADWFDPWAGKPDEVALLQHSSGTTGLQKGVALTHQAIIKHNFAYAERLSLAGDDRIVSWLPLYHDMGLIACFMLPLLLRIPVVEISPFDWVLRPASLLEQIHRQRGTLCWLPDFAFRFMAESVRRNELPDLDLTSIRAWVNCSEPVYHSAHVAFYHRFREYGVNWQQFTASYAMAENVFAVTQSLPGDYRVLRVNGRVFSEAHRIELDNRDGSPEFVSNGRPVAGTEVSVIDKDGKPMPENSVGEIAIRGDCRFSGYFRRDDLTKQSLIGEGWFQTGDLGFVHDGEIYITGRRKDLIIIQGRNFYPADIETIVSEIDGVVPGRAVAFGVPNENTGTEQLIVIAETIDHQSEQARHLALRIRNVVAQELDCIPADVRVVPTRWLIKSTSGKLARADNRNKYLENFVKEDQVTPAYV